MFEVREGMTIWDEYAKAAMLKIISRAYLSEIDSSEAINNLCQNAAKIADGMMAERELRGNK